MIVPPTLIPSIITTITKIASSIGPMIAKYAPMVIEIVGKNLPKVVNTVEAISLVADVLKPNERADELGAKAMAAEKTPEDFEQINDYIDYLRNDVEIDEENLSTDAVDVITRQAVGVAITAKGIAQTLEADVSIPFLNAISQLEIDPKVAIALVKSYEASSISADDVQKYLDYSLNVEDIHLHREVFVSAYQVTNPDMSFEEAEDAVMELR
ncbi:TPA: hypothetical protein N2903_004238 [Vibrio parahaemolyticus]|uniref:hypothetical protein n=1 Tax=Vibrio parahaemolyticus TaxID=670 RepID=UPI0009B075F5|nr:hypothetical protein [Vibrio parahaemolyticus]EGR1275325.1 hypothetical protein [Vibrio parahaemolyticus]EHZ2723080.1 hypothetical protein [Vibrio parahaemolyticus]EIO3707026.1 hypothetical protein [Vibrio parahaemolyticus]EIO4602998.1 hypothetical protein [Vibrio parahaemolyticus]EIV1595809.1 hypothetical protein [Vibrio parahaemolyticus]